MFFVILRKMFKNKWLSLCLLLGFTLAIATISSIPLFTQGATFKEYTKYLKEYQISSNKYPGGSLIEKILDPKDNVDYSRLFQSTENLINKDLINKMSIPLLSRTYKISTIPKDTVININTITKKNMNFSALLNFEDHIKVISGRMYTTYSTGDIYETVMTDTDMRQYKLALDKVYSVNGVSYTVKGEKGIEIKYKLNLKIKIVGIIAPKSDDDMYWYYNLLERHDSLNLYMNYQLFKEEFIKSNPILPINLEWYSAFDYNKINMSNFESIKSICDTWSAYHNKGIISGLGMPMVTVLAEYTQNEKDLTKNMWLFCIPILIVLGFYIFMISRLIIEFDKNEIALITSRGGGRFFIFIGYLIQVLLISAASLIIGPFLGILVCKVIGASDSFMEFVNRNPLPVNLNAQTYLYCFYAIGIFLVVMLATAMLFSNTTIIEYKQNKSRATGKFLNLKFILGMLLLLFAAYWLYFYKGFENKLGSAQTSTGTFSIDPFIFINAAIFIFGAGLFLINLFPYIVRFILWIGKKIWSPAIFTAFVQIGRSGGKEQFLMVFIVLTLSIGIFNANSARTINRNAEEEIQYETGADITLTGKWDINIDNRPTDGDYAAAAWGNKDAIMKIDKYNIEVKLGLVSDKYIEPPFTQYSRLEGVDKATKVLVKKDISINKSDTKIQGVSFYGINSKEFGEVAWFRPELMKYHWYQYLNLLGQSPEGLLLSRSFQKNYKIEVGDRVTLDMGNKAVLDAVVCDFIDYWPGFNPKKDWKTDNYLVVANIGYIFNQVPIEPYQVWLKKKTGVSSEEIYKQIIDKKIGISDFTDTNSLVVKKKNEPIMMATNGSLTLGFILTLIICLNGFLIYWVMSLKNRSLQFGIMRAMGIPSRNIIGMLTMEHLLTSGSAIIAGIAIGDLASRIYIPLFKLAYNPQKQALPFRVIMLTADYIKLYSIIAVMLIAAFAILGVITKSVKITQAVKLGED
jgi:putative ABC transport system permease protein